MSPELTLADSPPQGVGVPLGAASDARDPTPHAAIDGHTEVQLTRQPLGSAWFATPPDVFTHWGQGLLVW